MLFRVESCSEERDMPRRPERGLTNIPTNRPFRNHATDCVCTYGLLVITLTAAAWITHFADLKTSFEHFSGSIGGFPAGWENLEQ